MTLPAIEELCDALDEIPNELCILFPGAAQLCAQPTDIPPSLLQIAKQMLGQANAAMAPLQPIFAIIEALAAVQQCIEAIPDALGPPPNPSKMAACVPELARKIERVLALLPALSVPALIVGLLDTLILMIDGVIFELQAIVRLLQQIAAAKVIPAPGLLAAIDCAETTVVNQMSNIQRAFASMNALIDLANTLGGLAGLPEIPSLDGIVQDDPAGAIEALGDVRDNLVTLRDSIPVP